MNNYEHLSDEQLNAFIDDQLDSEERNRVFLSLQQDKELSQRACELRKLKDLVRHAYDELPQPEPRHPPRRRTSPYFQGVAAGLLLIVGSVAGWMGHLYTTPAVTSNFHNLTKLQALQLDPVSHGQKNIILHLNSNDAFKVATALDETEQLLRRYRNTGTPVKVEIVANGDALSLLRSDSSPFSERAQELVGNYDNLSILACVNTLKLLELQGIDTTLIPGVRKTNRSALEQVVNRLQDGWMYIKV